MARRRDGRLECTTKGVVELNTAKDLNNLPHPPIRKGFLRESATYQQPDVELLPENEADVPIIVEK